MSKQYNTRDMDALVLAGGESRRVGSPKALLPLGNTNLIGAVLARLQPLFRRVLVVARDGESLAGLGATVLVDGRLERGPLVGLTRGLEASDAPWCFVVGCDMPFLSPAVIHRMVEHLSGCDILAPSLGGHLQTLHAFYGRACLPLARGLLKEGNTSPRALFPLCTFRTMEATEFLDIDPELLSFRDLDTVEEYQAALQLAQDLERQEAGQ
ncbi:MAG: putative molybdenum cofactor guanylyltransferase [Dehalococcoidia bacterium]|nr:putative molybdenum cofactor guanylyltransferase [Dehalococcoidia bacterium]